MPDQSAVTITQRPASSRPHTDSRSSTGKHLIYARNLTRYHTTKLRATPRPFHLSKSMTLSNGRSHLSSPRWLRVVGPAFADAATGSEPSTLAFFQGLSNARSRQP